MEKWSNKPSALTPDETDRQFMRTALAIGYRNLGQTWPNPSVGAVVVAGMPDQPIIIAEGVTCRGGRPHAERAALDAAGIKARGATLYVTLEPCAHLGRSAPCCDAAIASGIKRVVAGILDPDKRVAGEGFARLRASGVEVVSDVLADEARWLHRGHLKRVTQKRPFVTVKMARTRDGYASSGTNERLLITGATANARTHMIRAHSDAILIGVSTANADNPGLDVRLPGMGDRSPVRVVFDSALTINPELNLVKTATQLSTWVVASEQADGDKEKLLTDFGVHVIRVAESADGKLDPAEALHRLHDRGLSTILCEGGPTLARAMAINDLADEFVLVNGAIDYNGPGIKALLPETVDILAERFRLAHSELAGSDEFVFYEKAE